jgi:hypothetical protein
MDGAGPARTPNQTAHLNDPASRRSPAGKSAGAMDEAADEASHSDRSPLTDTGATPRDEEARRQLDAAAADVDARHSTGHERESVRADREASLDREAAARGSR